MEEKTQCMEESGKVSPPSRLGSDCLFLGSNIVLFLSEENTSLGCNISPAHFSDVEHVYIWWRIVGWRIVDVLFCFAQLAVGLLSQQR